MKNSIVCKSCNTENPFYALNCSKCKAYLRERIYNIDFWAVSLSLIDTPSNAFKKIIHSEHKNFIFLIVILAAIKFFILSIFLQEYFTKSEHVFRYLSTNLLDFAVLFFVFLLLISLIITYSGLIFGLKTRFKDNLAITIYSLMPYVVGLILLFPVELIVFGQYLFSTNPSPFQIKPTLAYMLLAIEGILILWSLLLSGIALIAQSKSIIYSVVMDAVFYIILFGFAFYFWKVIG